VLKNGFWWGAYVAAVCLLMKVTLQLTSPLVFFFFFSITLQPRVE